MRYSYCQTEKSSKITLRFGEEALKSDFNPQSDSFYTIVWNRGSAQILTIDQLPYTLPGSCVLPIMMNQQFEFERPEEIVMWQFNRDFYCTITFDSEVGCIGFLFYGANPIMFIELDSSQNQEIQALVELFEEEFAANEEIQGEMLRSLLVRLIIKMTRLAKKQYLGKEDIANKPYNLMREFNLLVEKYFRSEHQVQFYADKLHKSPKTLANVFSTYSPYSPLQIIHNRIIVEAKKLFLLTDKSVKEVANELGFEDAAHFSHFFKKATSINPKDFRKVMESSR